MAKRPYPTRKKAYATIREFDRACQAYAMKGFYPPEEGIVLDIEYKKAKQELRLYMKDLMDRAGLF